MVAKIKTRRRISGEAHGSEMQAQASGGWSGKVSREVGGEVFERPWTILLARHARDASSDLTSAAAKTTSWDSCHRMLDIPTPPASLPCTVPATTTRLAEAADTPGATRRA